MGKGNKVDQEQQSDFAHVFREANTVVMVRAPIPPGVKAADLAKALEPMGSNQLGQQQRELATRLSQLFQQELEVGIQTITVGPAGPPQANLPLDEAPRAPEPELKETEGAKAKVIKLTAIEKRAYHLLEVQMGRPLRASTVAIRLYVTIANATKALDGLIEKGLVTSSTGHRSIYNAKSGLTYRSSRWPTAYAKKADKVPLEDAPNIQ